MRHLVRLIEKGGWRALRTFTQTFLAVLIGSPLLSINVSTLKTAAVGGIGAVLSLIQRALDDTSVPTLPVG